MSKAKTRQATLYRLVPEVQDTRSGIRDALAPYENLSGLHPRDVEVAGMPGVWFEVQEDEKTASWCADAAVTTGLNIRCTEARSGGLLILGVEGTAYALSYGSGYLLIPDELKDQRFGLSFLVRRLNADKVSNMLRRQPSARGLTVSALIAGGAPAWRLGAAESVEIIRRIGGKAEDLKVTFSSQTSRKVKIEGAAGLRMRFGVEPEDLVNDIRECARVCREEEPNPALEFIEYIQPVADAWRKDILDLELDDLLSGDAESAKQLAPVVPSSVLDSYDDANSLTIRLGRPRTVYVSEFDLDDLLSCVRHRQPGDRVRALRRAIITLNSDDAGIYLLDRAATIKWLEVTLSLGPERYFLMDGDWFEVGAEYVRACRDAIIHLFPDKPGVSLPSWYLPKNRTELDYNKCVAARYPGEFLCLDQNKKVRDPRGSSRSSLEICDLLGPNGELIHVKRAKASAPLSHLFSQGLVSAQDLLHGPASVRKQFTSEAARLGRVLPEDFTPKKVVFAILMDNGKTLTPDTLFPFSQVTLLPTPPNSSTRTTSKSRSLESLLRNGRSSTTA